MDFESKLDAATIFISFAADELFILGEENCKEALELYKLSANVCMNNTFPIKIEPFQFDRYKEIRDVELVEKAYEAWKHVYKISNHKLRLLTTQNINTNKDLVVHLVVSDSNHNQEKYYYLQQSMLAMYHAGICALAMNDFIAAQRAFESSEEIRFDIDKIIKVLYPTPLSLSPHSSTDSNTDQQSNMYEYYLICGDLSYHLSHTYFKQTKYTQTIEECKLAKYFYTQACGTNISVSDKPTKVLVTNNSRMPQTQHPRELSQQLRFRLRQNLHMLAMAQATLGEDIAGVTDETLTELSDLYIGPVENKDIELLSLRKYITEQEDKRRKHVFTLHTTTVNNIHITNTYNIHQDQDSINHASTNSAIMNPTNKYIISNAYTKEDLNAKFPMPGNNEIDWDLMIAYSIIAFTVAFLTILFYPNLYELIITFSIS